MKTVEIFLQDDFKDELIDSNILDEVNKIKQELNLSCGNQLSDKSQIPYLWIDDYTQSCFRVLCPRSVKLSNYTNQIPLEALKNAKQSMNENHFDWIEIWSNEKDPDPFMIGFVYDSSESREKQYTWRTNKYLIARWGSEKKPISELISDALNICEKRVLQASLRLESKVIGIINYLKDNPRIAAEEALRNSTWSSSGFDAKDLLKRELDL